RHGASQPPGTLARDFSRERRVKDTVRPRPGGDPRIADLRGGRECGWENDRILDRISPHIRQPGATLHVAHGVPARACVQSPQLVVVDVQGVRDVVAKRAWYTRYRGPCARSVGEVQLRAALDHLREVRLKSGVRPSQDAE